MSNSLTIRVYGLLIDNKQILLSRENIKGQIHTKFPGGGLEPGEGLTDCLKREFMEEVGIQLTQTRHFYTTEDYFSSSFHTDKRQVVSIYYRVWTEQLADIITKDPENVKLLSHHNDQVLYWAPLQNIGKQPIHLPIDKIVVSKLIS